MKPLTIVNFSHPMKEEIQIEVMRGLGMEPKRLAMNPGDPEVLTNLVYCEVQSQFDLEQPLADQVQALLATEEAAAWIRGTAVQNIVWVLPRLTEAAAVLVAELLERVPPQYPVRVVRLVQDRSAAVPVFKLAEIITLRQGETYASE